MAGGTAMVTGGFTWKPNSSTKSSSTSYSSGSTYANTSAAKANTAATKANTKAQNTATASAKKLGELYDWVAIRLTYFANKTKAVADKINDYISSATKRTYLAQEWSLTKDEMAANATGAMYYKRAADNVARSTGMSGSLISKAQTGAWQFENLSDANKEKVETYLQYYDKYTEATQKVQELRNQQLQLYSDWANMPTEAAEKKINRLTTAIDGLKNAYSLTSSGGSATRAYGNVVDAFTNADVRGYTTQVNNAKTAKANAQNAVNAAKTNLKNSQTTTASTTKALKTAINSNKKRVSTAIQNKINTAIKNGKKISLTTAELKTLPATVKTQITKYNNAITAQTKAQSTLTSAQTKLTTANQTYSDANNKLNSLKSALTDAQKIGSAQKTQKSYIASNALLDAEVVQQGNVVKEYNEALKNTTSQVATSAKQLTSAKSAATSATNAVKKSADTILKNKNYTKLLSNAQLTNLKNGKAVGVANIKNSALLKALNNYNALVTTANVKTANLTDKQTEHQIILDAQQDALANLANAEYEYAQLQVDAEREKFNNIKGYYEAELGYIGNLTDAIKDQREIREKYGIDTEAKDYQDEIDSLEKERKALSTELADLEKQLADAVASKVIITGTEEWWDMKNAIADVNASLIDTESEILDLQDEMRNEVFYRSLERALEKAEQLGDALKSISDLIDDDMLFNDDGQITDFGITKMAYNIKEYENGLTDLQTLLAKRNRIIALYNNGNNNTNYSQKEFDEDMKEVTSDIQKALSDVDSFRKSIIDLVIKTSKAELDATLEIIDAREELLQKKKEYYEYDKNLKQQTEGIQLLDQQISALETMDDLESKAMRRRLEEQREQARENLEETVKDHVYDLQINGLDDLKTELQNDYDAYVKDLAINLEKITGAVSTSTDTITAMLGTVDQTVKTLLESYGVTGLTQETVGVPHFASGTKRVGRNTWAETNEAGGEIVVTDKGVFMPLSADSSVVPSAMTSKLFGLAENYSAIMGSLSGKSGETIAPYINAPITITGNNIDEKGVIRAINQQLPLISERVQNDIRRDLMTYN